MGPQAGMRAVTSAVLVTALSVTAQPWNGAASSVSAAAVVPLPRIASLAVDYTPRKVVATVKVTPNGSVAQMIAAGGSVWTTFFFLGGPTVKVRRNESNPTVPPRAPIKTVRNSQRINCGATVAVEPARDRYVFTVPVECAPGAGTKVRAQAAVAIPHYSSVTPPTKRR